MCTNDHPSWHPWGKRIERVQSGALYPFCDGKLQNKTQKPTCHGTHVNQLSIACWCHISLRRVVVDCQAESAWAASCNVCRSTWAVTSHIHTHTHIRTYDDVHVHIRSHSHTNEQQYKLAVCIAERLKNMFVVLHPELIQPYRTRTTQHQRNLKEHTHEEIGASLATCAADMLLTTPQQSKCDWPGWLSMLFVDLRNSKRDMKNHHWGCNITYVYIWSSFTIRWQ